jgi:hypothetical protein
MAQAAPIIMAISSAAGAAYSIKAGMDAKDAASKAAAEQERLAHQNAANIEAETMEEHRRSTKEAESAEATARARAAATGVDTDEESSMSLVLNERQAEAKRQLDWIKRSGKSRADLARRSGMSQATSTRNAGNAAAWEGVAGGIRGVGNTASVINNNWN